MVLLEIVLTFGNVQMNWIAKTPILFSSIAQIASSIIRLIDKVFKKELKRKYISMISYTLKTSTSTRRQSIFILPATDKLVTSKVISPVTTTMSCLRTFLWQVVNKQFNTPLIKHWNGKSLFILTLVTVVQPFKEPSSGFRGKLQLIKKQ